MGFGFSKDGTGLTAADVPTDPASKEFADFRDRAAYVYVMGSFPTHIRTYFTTLLSLLSLVSKSVREPASLDKSFGSVKLDDAVVSRLILDEHPMVRRVRLLMAEGYRLHRTGTITERRPYGRVPMHNSLSGQTVIVQIDGSVNDGRV